MKYAIYCLMLFSLVLPAKSLMAQAVTTPAEQIIIDHSTHQGSADDAHRMLANDTLSENLMRIFNRKMPRIAEELFEYLSLLSMENLANDTEDMIQVSLLELFTDGDSIYVVLIKDRSKSSAIPIKQWIELQKKEDRNFKDLQKKEKDAITLFSLSSPGPVKKCYVKKGNNTTYCLTFALQQKPKNFGRETVIMWDVYIAGIEVAESK